MGLLANLVVDEEMEAGETGWGAEEQPAARLAVLLFTLL